MNWRFGHLTEVPYVPVLKGQGFSAPHYGR
jgi:hypothetical protein